MKRIRNLVWATSCVLTVLAAGSHAPAADLGTLLAEVQGRTIEAMPLAWSDANIALLTRDGQLLQVKPDEVKNFRRGNSSFHPLSAAEMRDVLQRELGPRFEVTGTGHYLVAWPAGQKDQWAERFEQLYRSMSQYMSARSIPLRSPQYPLVAIVWKTQAEMMQYSAREGTNVSAGVLGYYSIASNRVTMYDQGAGHADNAEWQRNYATVVHEAAHQTAYNTGVHNRYSPPPKWLVEGLGTLFEAPGVWNSQLYTKQSDRINAGRFNDFRQFSSQGLPAGALADLISGDRSFQFNPGMAYALSWSLTFYLVETRQADYVRYLNKMAELPDFQNYPSAKRLSDFTSIFGSDLKMFEAHWLRYMKELKN